MNTIQRIPLENIVLDRFQKEGIRDQGRVLEIASSLRQNKDNGTSGLLQVPTARQIDGGKYELAFGHHRFYAFQENAKEDPFFGGMPLLIRELTDIEMFELMGIENFHRRDISPIEEASIFNAYMTQFKKTSVDTAAKFEKTDEYVRASIRLLSLPSQAQDLVSSGALNKTAARSLLQAHKLGGEELVNESLESITEAMESSGTVNAQEEIVSAIRSSKNTKFLDEDAGWYAANKKFPHKHLPPITADTLDAILKFQEGNRNGPKSARLEQFSAILTLLSAGMDVTSDSFPMFEEESLERLRVLANPGPCDKCPIHVVMDGIHVCGMPICASRKMEAWEKKEKEDEINKIGVPLYQKSDGPYAALDNYSPHDRKLWKDGHADLRLIPAKYVWNNFEGVGSSFKVVAIGKLGADRIKKLTAREKKEQIERENQSKARALKNIVEQHMKQFEWEIACRPFEALANSTSNVDALAFVLERVYDGVLDDDLLPESQPAISEMIDSARGAKASGVMQLRRLIGFAIAEQGYDVNFNYSETRDAEKPIIQYAKEFQELAAKWEVKIPKDFMHSAEEYQEELDKALTEVE